MDKNLDEVEFTVFDTETTGLEPKSGDRIIEIAAIRFKAKEKKGAFQSLINPHRDVSDAAFAVNKITPQMLRDAPDISEVLPEFLDFIRDSCLCSYNAGFDLEFLNNETQLIGAALAQDLMVVDILKMARRLLPGLQRYALVSVAQKLGLKQQQQHRAFSDTELALEVFYKLKEILQSKGVSSFMNFLTVFSINSHFLENVTTQKLAQMQEAINRGLRLKIRYLSSSGSEVTEREVVPYEIRQENNRSYLVGYCCLRNQERSFRVDGILHLEIM